MMEDFSHVYIPIFHVLKDLDILVLKEPLQRFKFKIPEGLINEKNQAVAFENLFQIIRFIPPSTLIKILRDCEGEHYYDWIIAAIENQSLYKDDMTVIKKPQDEHKGKLTQLNNFSAKLALFIRAVDWDTFYNFQHLLVKEVTKIQRKTSNDLHISFAYEAMFRFQWAEVEKSTLQQSDFNEKEKNMLHKMKTLLPKTMFPDRCKLMLLAIMSSVEYFHEENREKGIIQSEEFLEEADQLAYKIFEGREIGNYLYGRFNIRQTQFFESIEMKKKLSYNKYLLVKDAEHVMDVFKEYSVHNGIHLWMFLKLAKLHVGLNKTCRIVLEDKHHNVKEADKCLKSINENKMLKMAMSDKNRLTYLAVKSRLLHLGHEQSEAIYLLEDAIMIAKNIGMPNYVKSLEFNMEIYKNTSYDI